MCTRSLPLVHSFVEFVFIVVGFGCIIKLPNVLYLKNI